MSSAEEEYVLQEFQNITHLSDERSRFYLESAGWKLDLALSTFYQEVDEEPEVLTAPSESETSTSGSRHENDVKFSNVSNAACNRRSGNVATLSDCTGRTGRRTHEDESEESDDSGSDAQAFFAGSGQQILGPGRQSHEGFVTKLFEQLRKKSFSSAEEGVSRNPTSSGQSSVFSGAAYRLGSTLSDTASPSDPTLISGQSSRPRRNVELNLWSNGFSVDDGDLCSYESPDGRRFMSDIMVGKIPSDLVSQVSGEELHVSIKDCRSEEFKAKKKTVKPFQGRGQMLGGVVPDVMSADTSGHVETQSNLDFNQLENEARSRIGLRPDEEQTSVQVRFPDPSVARLVCRLNHRRHTVGHLRQYIQIARPVVSNREFSLNLTFPNRKLTDNDQTVEEAGLKGACVMLRFV